MESHDFEISSRLLGSAESAQYPFTARCQDLAGVSLLAYHDGVHVLARCWNDQQGKPVFQAYSPMLSRPGLEIFCELNLGAYQAYYEESQQALLESLDPPPFKSFWQIALTFHKTTKN